MNALTDGIDNLISLAQQILSTDGDYILVIEEYARALSEVEPRLNEAAKNVALTEKVAQLKTLHENVMARVESDKDKIRKELSALKKKGKIVITYTDQLPKRISLGTRKKV